LVIPELLRQIKPDNFMFWGADYLSEILVQISDNAILIIIHDSQRHIFEHGAIEFFTFGQSFLGLLTLLFGMPQAPPPGKESSGQGQHQKAACQADHGAAGGWHQHIEVAQQH